jgi:hypothetical protein
MMPARPRRGGAFVATAAAAAVLFPAPAEAAEHLMVVQEVFPGTPANPDAQYVMLRYTSPFQTVVNTHYISVQDANGVVLGRFGTFDHNVANSGVGCVYPNCPSILMGTAAAQALFGFAFDQIVDAQAGRVALPLEAGRVCFRRSTGTDHFDCVAYGAYAAPNTIPAPTPNMCDANLGAPAAALTPGYALARVAFSCASKENSTDFALRFPHPRANNNGNADVDADGDGLVNVLDCGDADPDSWYAPVLNPFIDVDDSGPSAVVSWASQDATAGPSTVYDVISGDAVDLVTMGDFTSAACMARGVAGTSAADPDPLPAPGRGRYYAARARNGCGAATYGDGGVTPDPRDLLDDRTNGPCM